MNRQEILNTVAEKLIGQGGPAMVFDGILGRKVCAYRGADGWRCAIGHLIPDDMYRSDMENQSVCELIDKGWLPEGLRDTEFLSWLQEIHDEANPRHFCSDVAEMMLDVVNQYGLEMPAACLPYFQGRD